MRSWSNHKRRPKSSSSPSFRAPRLACESLEGRLVLSSAPVLDVVGDQWATEDTTLSIVNIGTFTDVVEGTAGGGGSSVGLDPMAYAALPAFDPGGDVFVNTSAPGAPILSVGATQYFGVYQTANTGYDDYTIAVFTFASFELDEDITLRAAGTSPLAILSQSTMSIAGTIDLSATPDGSESDGQRLAGAGGGDGGYVIFSGSVPSLFPANPAAGAPADSAATLQNGGGGPGGGHGGIGGGGESNVGGPGGIVGLSFGDLSLGIQGGSGGASAGVRPSFAFVIRPGGGGGGGIELGAVGAITVTSSGVVLANGGKGSDYTDVDGTPGSGGAGGGAGGGILIHSAQVNLNGSLSAKGGDGGHNAQRGGGGGGGGEVYISYSDAANSNVDDIVLANHVDVSGGLDYYFVGPDAVPTGGAPGEVGVLTLAQQAPAVVAVIESYTYSINWGDGSAIVTGSATIDVPGANIGDTVQGSFDGSHVYADFGFYTVTVSVISNTGSGAAETTDTDSFQVIVPGVGVKGGSLVVIGSNSNDSVEITRSGSNTYKVASSINGYCKLQSFSGNTFTNIEISLFGGNDLAFISSNVSRNATIDGGAGNDILMGGSGNDILLGQSGIDILYGGDGRDLMIGGEGSDLLYGDGGEDILISGTTAFDLSAGNELDLILKEWTSSRTYAQRKANITGTGSGSSYTARLNGNNFLRAAEVNATVFDDNDLDILLGGNGTDMFFEGDCDLTVATWSEFVAELEADAPTS